MNKRDRGGGRGATQYVRGNYKSFKGTNLTVVEGMHQFIMLYHLPGIVIIFADLMLLGVVYKHFLGVVVYKVL